MFTLMVNTCLLRVGQRQLLKDVVVRACITEHGEYESMNYRVFVIIRECSRRMTRRKWCDMNRKM